MTRRRRILMLAPFAPRLDANHGGGRAIANLAAALAPAHDVRLLCVRATHELPVDPALTALGVRAEEFRRALAMSGAGRLRRKTQSLRRAVRGLPSWASHCWLPALAARLRTLVAEWQPHVVQFEFHVMGQYEASCPVGPFVRVLTQHEPGVQAGREQLRTARSLARAAAFVDLVSWRRYERRVLRRMDAVVAFTARDAAITAEAAPRARVEYIPLGINVPERALDPRGATPGQVLFVGNYRHPPNVDAALRLVRDILPLVRTRVPDATVVIVGAAPPRKLVALVGPHVRVTGEVPSVEPLLAAAAVVALPLRQGGGMRVKALEALAAGKAVVATRLALEGLSVADGTHALIADDDSEFAEAVASLLLDADRRVRLGSAARAWAEAAPGWSEVARRYSALYDTLAVGTD